MRTQVSRRSFFNSPCPYGYSQDPDVVRNPRGIRGFQLNNGTFGTWKVQGKLGGYTKYALSLRYLRLFSTSPRTSFPDKTRGILNDGGLFAQRQGWHLPGFNASSWPAREFSAGLPNATVGVGFFITTFDLEIPRDLDVMMSFQFDESMQPYRALLFVNGWYMGKRIASLGYAVATHL